MHGDTRVVSWKSVAVGAPVDAAGFEAMEAIDRKHREESRKRMRSRERDRELEAMVKNYATRAAREEKRNRPVQIKTFEV